MRTFFSRISRRDGRVERERVANRGQATVAAILLLVLVLAAIIVPIIQGSEATDPVLGLRNIPPWLFGGTPEHVLGTDQLGRDMLGRLMLAARVSLSLALAVIVVALIAGTLLGIVAGYRRGIQDDIIMRLSDVIASFPSLLLAVVVLFILGSGIVPMIIVLAVTRLPIFIRVARAETLRIRETDYVAASRVLGYGLLRTIRGNFVPNLASPVLTVASLSIAQVMLAEAALSFLGVGIQPPLTSWGLMAAQGKDYISSAWWLVVFPGVAIVLTTLAILAISNYLAQVLDPRRKG